MYSVPCALSRLAQRPQPCTPGLCRHIKKAPDLASRPNDRNPTCSRPDPAVSRSQSRRPQARQAVRQHHGASSDTWADYAHTERVQSPRLQLPPETKIRARSMTRHDTTQAPKRATRCSSTPETRRPHPAMELFLPTDAGSIRTSKLSTPEVLDQAIKRIYY